MRKYYIGMTIITLLILGGVLLGFGQGGSPFAQRAYTLDSKRISDMNSIKYSIENYYKNNSRLPETLDQISPKITYTDPDTKKPYDYKTVNSTSYQLCTNFSADTSNLQNPNIQYEDMYLGSDIPHKKGYDCLKYNLSSYLLYTQPTPGAVSEWREFKNTFLAEFDSQAASDTEPRIIVKENFVTKIIYTNDSEILDKNGGKTQISAFSQGDRLLIDTISIKGANNYKASRIQNLTR